ncbi:MAG TPA: 1-(5-phosphoribosyl)-5-[(5-phosphoribosylamino)methylideneamino]imidazole-4-carboxamide isomerase [Alphaproteobacteria bacterium]|nr:1-(5-phosphoribosyl)-5-[(5-phosphoribosylamino)methylideneamino]imidazole-4-carboxamide isomerase [Alphaproteobacteria bacterium]
MILYPAIDLKDGQCVRLIKGEMDSATVFNTDPAAQARAFELMGFRWLHVVDLDGAVEGHSANADVVESILRRVAIPVQLGGGIRSRAQIEFWLQRGVARVILGTAAVRDADLVREVAQAYPGRIAAGIDARAGIVAVEGWAQGTHLTAGELANRMQDAGVATIIYTDIARDGTGLGINIAETLELAESVQIPVIASGGFGGMADLDELLSARDGCDNVSGVIIGRALYDGRIDSKAALDRVRNYA